MGLDSFWKGSVGVTFNPPLRLIGGMLSGNGDGSFRGKCYADFVERVTGESLYQEVIKPEVVKQMAEKIAVQQWEEQEAGREFENEVEFKDLQRMFQAYAAAGHSLCGWW
jgi:hypothetical protein